MSDDEDYYDEYDEDIFWVEEPDPTIAVRTVKPTYLPETLTQNRILHPINLPLTHSQFRPPH